MRFGRRKITYYDTEAGFEAEKFAARLLLLLMNEMRASGRRQVVFLCIGTDRSTGDSLGPLIGSRLEAEEISNVVVIGTLEHPVHAVNLDRTIEEMEEHYPDAIIVAVDAAVGRWDHVGLVTLEKGPLRPGRRAKGTYRRWRHFHHRDRRRGGERRPIIFTEHTLVPGHAACGLHQPQHLPWIADHRETCRKLFRSDCAVLTCFADLPCYTSERIRRSAFTWFA